MRECHINLAMSFAEQDSRTIAESCGDCIADTYPRDNIKNVFEGEKHREKAIVFIADFAILLKHLHREL